MEGGKYKAEPSGGGEAMETAEPKVDSPGEMGSQGKPNQAHLIHIMA